MRLLIALLSCSLLLAAEQKLGKPLTLTEQTPIAKIASEPAQFLDKTIQVKGKISEVCQSMGCWMMLTDADGKAIKIKVKDGEIVFPKDSAGKMAVAEGKLVKIEMTKAQAIAQAKHEAEENGRKFNPASVKGPVTTYQIQGSGAVLLD